MEKGQTTKEKMDKEERGRGGAERGKERSWECDWQEETEVEEMGEKE